MSRSSGLTFSICLVLLGPAALGGPLKLYDTLKHYLSKPGSAEVLPVRKELHDRIIARQLEGRRPSDHREIIFFAGVPGAGKSTVIERLLATGVLDPHRYVYINVDHLQAQIPETQEFLKQDWRNGAAYTFSEAGYLARRLYAEALKGKLNIISDSTFSSGDVILNQANEVGGYNKYLIVVEVNASTARARIDARASAHGRYLPDPEILVERASEKIAGLVAPRRSSFRGILELNNDKDLRLRAVETESLRLEVDHPLGQIVGLRFGQTTPSAEGLMKAVQVNCLEPRLRVLLSRS